MGCGCGGAKKASVPALSGEMVSVVAGSAVQGTTVMMTKDRRRIVLTPGNTSDVYCVPVEDVQQYPNIYQQLGSCSS